MGSERPPFRTPGRGLADHVPDCHAGTVPSTAIHTSSSERQVLRFRVQLQSAFPFSLNFSYTFFAD